ncbi:MAG: DegT/DnrJ/EryC1/StrS family aminotransferase [Deltaproteobacteria bacterium]|nr:DegT/DnrJ/EryC1/StrS family aminotransferase [Deltaproteobacteria bacterium]
MIPQNNPLANYLNYKQEIDEAVQRVMASGSYILGEETSVLEQQFADYIGVKYAVGVGSGTEALHLALRAFGIGKEDEVITVSHTALATVAAIEMCGAIPVLVDIDPVSYTISPNEAENAISDRTKAIVPVHLYGQPADLQPLIDLTRRLNLYLIEDCAQSHGAMYRAEKVGAFGNAAIFSFYPTKNLGCLGDGGIVTTDSPDIHDRLISLRQYGWDSKRVSQMAGYNSRLDELQAAILRVKLKYLDADNKKRIIIAENYNTRLNSVPLHLPVKASSTSHVYHQYVIGCKSRSFRDGLMGYLSSKNIQSAIHYPVPVHLQPAYENRIVTGRRLLNTEKASDTILSLPMFPELTDKDINRVTDTIKEFFAGNRN